MKNLNDLVKALSYSIKLMSGSSRCDYLTLLLAAKTQILYIAKVEK